MSHEIGYAPGVSTRNNVSEFLRELAERRGDLPLLTWLPPGGSPEGAHRSVSAGELWTQVRHLAAGFRREGLQPGDRVLVFLPMSLPMYLTMFALQHMGAVPVFLDSWARRAELGAGMEIADTVGVVSFPMAFDLLGGAPQLASMRWQWVFGGDSNTPEGTPRTRLETLMAAPEPAPTQAVGQEHTALITFTTGSTGRPKGADRSHRFLAAQHYALARHLEYGPTDVDLPVFPIFSLNNIASGVTTVLPALDLSRPSPEDPSRLVAQFRSCGVTCATLSPWLFRAVADLCLERNLSLGLRRIVTGGAPVSLDDVRRMRSVAPQARILILYGSTEAEPIAHLDAQDWIQASESGSPDPLWVEDGTNVGRIDPGLQVRFLKLQDIPHRPADQGSFDALQVGPGEVGELLIAGEHVCQAYFRDPEATARAKVVAPDGGIWHRTGDLGFVDGSGFLRLVGRVHNVVRHARGPQFPVRAEMVLRKAPWVERSAYLGMPGTEGSEQAWCVVQASASARVRPASDLRAELEGILARNGIVHDRIEIVDEIPVDSRHHSKVEYAQLRARLPVPGAA